MRKMLLALTAFAATAAAPAPTAKVVVTVTGLQAQGGTLNIALATQGDVGRSPPRHVTVVPVTAAGNVTVTMTRIPIGTYRVTALHQVGKGQGPSVGTPASAPAKIAVSPSGSAVTVAMRYP